MPDEKTTKDASEPDGAEKTEDATSKRAPGPRRTGPGRRARFLGAVLLIAIGLQIPLLLALGTLVGHAGLLALAAAALTGGFLSSLLGGRTALGDPGKLRLYLATWPFFVYWTAAMLFALLAPFVLLIAGVTPVTLHAALAGGLVVALVLTASAFFHDVRVRRPEITIPALPAAFDGFRIAQISDLHCGPFASGRRVAAWVARVNGLEADVVAVTGDLIASGARFVSVVARELGGLRARDGVFASMGNHDYFTEGDAMADALAAAGLSVLRNTGVELERGGAKIFLAGVDDTWTGRDDLTAALAARPAGMPTVLLAHDPALFSEAAARGVALTLSGHTHGGQLGVPFFSKRWNLARVITRFTTGLYQDGAATLYVTRGLGTTGVPIRLLVPPEITVLTLRRGSTGTSGPA